MTLTKSWLQKQITDLEATRDEIPFGLDEDGNNTLAALKLALAGMEAEPVGWFVRKKFMHSHPTFKNSPNAFPLYAAPQPLTTSERAELENYRNAQQFVSEDAITKMAWDLVHLGMRMDESKKDDKAYRFETVDMGIKMVRAAMLQGKAEPAKTGLTLREGLAAIRISGIAIDAEKILAERDALNEPTCWCRTCRPVTVTDMRFVVCPQCGNKRCPHANGCRNACTGSNEPGQEGSAYPAAPQQETE